MRMGKAREVLERVCAALSTAYTDEYRVLPDVLLPGRGVVLRMQLEPLIITLATTCV